MGFNFGIFAGTLAEYFDKENERVSASTDKVLDSLANLVIRENDARQKKVDSAKESISRLEALGFNRATAASISRGGLYAVNDAANAATKAKDLGQDVNTYYAATSEFKPEDYAEYTVAELAQSIVPTLNIDKSAEALTKGRQINTTRVNDAVAKYRGSQIAPSDITLPTFAQDPEKFGGSFLDGAAQTKARTLYKRLITDRAEAIGMTKVGMTTTTNASGERISTISSPELYGKFIKEEIPRLLEFQKDKLPKREYEALKNHTDYILGLYTNAQPNIEEGSDKAKLIGTTTDPNIVKSTIRSDIASGISYEDARAEAVADGIPGDLFDQLYEEVMRQPGSGSGRNAPRGGSNEAPVVEQPVQAASQQVTGVGRRSARTGR